MGRKTAPVSNHKQKQLQSLINEDSLHSDSSLIMCEGIKLLHINCQSLIPKFEELKFFTLSNNISFLSINETWLNNSVMDKEIDIPGYVLFRQDRNDGYGGVAGGLL